MPELLQNRIFQELNNGGGDSSCIKKPPFVTIGTGEAPVLDYNLPVSTCFDVQILIPIKLPESYVKPIWFEKPENNIWSIIKDLTIAEIKQEVMSVLSGIPGEHGIFQNTDLLQGNSIQWWFEENTNEDIVLSITSGGELVKGGDGKKGRYGDGKKGGGGDDGKKGGGLGGDGKKGGGLGGYGQKGGDFSPGTLHFSDVDEIVMNISNGLLPVIVRDMYGILHIQYVREPKTPNPTLFIVKRLKVCSYLRNYGAAKTVATFSLLPGEKTTISIRTYKKMEKSWARAENILDSYSENSTKSFEELLQTESQETWSTVEGYDLAYAFMEKVGATIPLKKDITLNLNNALSGDFGYTNQSFTEDAINKLKSALDKHSAETASSRNVEVNTTTNESFITESEETIVRELANTNYSRVLNFVFRQLYQKYLTVTYLKEVSFLFTNGYPETLQIATLSDLLALCNNICNTTVQSQEVFEGILRELCNINDYAGNTQSFIECPTVTLTPCCAEILGTTTQKIVRKKKYTQTYDSITVPGIILDVSERILPTDSVICDALLGQGEALDCYNMRLQDAAALKAELENESRRLENLKTQQAIEIINLITDPEQRAALYKKVFGNCCDVPQVGCNCGNCNQQSPPIQ